MMRNIVLILTMASLSMCSKAPKKSEDFLPKIEIMSAIVNSDGSVTCTIGLISKGYGDLYNAGFAYSLDSSVKINESKQFMVENNLEGTAASINFIPDTTYHFRAFAINEYGFVTSQNIISLKNIQPALVTAPCTVPANSVRKDKFTNYENFNFIGKIASSGFGLYSFKADSRFLSMEFVFGQKPKQGVYKVIPISSSDPQGNNVKVSFFGGFTNSSLNLNEKIYVRNVGPKTYEITICNAAWDASPTFKSYLDARFEVQTSY